MAENSKISQIKLPNGSTYDIVDNTSGYSKVHIVTYTSNYDEELEQDYLTFDATYTEVSNWLSNEELVVLDSRSTGRSYYPSGSDRGVLIFSNADGESIIFKNNNTGSYRESPFLTSFNLSEYETDPVFIHSAANGITSTDITNWNNKLDSYTETDPTVPSWAKAANKPSYTFSEIGSTPTTLSGYGITNAYTKTEIDGLVAGVLHYKGTKASVANLPTTGNTTGDVWHITADGSEYAWDGTIWQELGTAVDLSSYVTTDDSRLSDARTPLAHNQALSTITGAEDLQAIEALSGTSGFLKKTAANTWTLDTNTYLTSYTETDPVFSASAAAGITSTDISNWNAKVSDDKTWNGVTLNKSSSVSQSNIYIPYVANTSATTANLVQVVVDTTGVSAANRIPKYNNSGYLVSTTPSANDNSTKVATTAYVDAAIPVIPTYKIGYSDNSIGSALVGTAITEEPNYTPSGDIALETENVEVVTNASVINWTFDGVKLTILGVLAQKGTISTLKGATFNGNSVTFKIEEVEE